MVISESIHSIIQTHALHVKLLGQRGSCARATCCEAGGVEYSALIMDDNRQANEDEEVARSAADAHSVAQEAIWRPTCQFSSVVFWQANKTSQDAEEK